jgi:flagellar biosynthetic protein FliR
MSALTEIATQGGFGLMLVLARVAGAVMLLPGFGETAPPAVLRAGMALCLTLLLLPGLLPDLPPAPEAGMQAGLMIGAEVLTGLWFGWLVRLLILALPVAAQFIAYLLGLSSVLQPDAQSGPQSTALARLFDLAAPLAVLSSDLYQLPLAALGGLYRLIPAGTLLPSTDGALTAIEMMTQMFALALRLAAPFVLAAVIWNVVLGLIARLVPRLQIYFVALPGQILGGFLLLAMLAGAILAAWSGSVRALLIALPGTG